MLVSVLLAAAVPFADAHAVLTYPKARAGQEISPGRKLTPYADFQRIIDQPGPDCGGEKGNPGPNPGPIQETFTAGQEIDVQWLMTIPHDVDRLDYGVRVAVHYGPGDSYAQNVLLDKADAGTGRQQTITAKVQLPPLKTSNNAVLQWTWGAVRDGGFYLGCSDIQIVAANNPGQAPPGGLPPTDGRGPADPSLAPPNAGPRGGAGQNGGINPVGGTRPGSNVGQPENDGGIVRGTSSPPRGATGGGTSLATNDEAADNNMYYLAGGAVLLLIIVVLYFKTQDKDAEDTAKANSQGPAPTVAVPPPPPQQTRV